MTQYGGEFNQTILEICEAEKKDLQDEVKHLKDVIKVKNQEIGNTKTKLRISETEMSELKNFLMSQVAALTAKLTHTTPAPHHPKDDNIESLLQSQDQADMQGPVSAAVAVPILHKAFSEATSADPTAKIDATPAPQPVPPVPSSSSQPAQKLPRPVSTTMAKCSDEELENLPVKKSKFKCKSCKEIFLTAMKLNHHVYHQHGNSSSDEDPFTPISNTQKNKARKMANRCKKIKMSNSPCPPEPVQESLFPILVNNNPKALRRDPPGPCPDCGKVILKSNLARHIKRGCKAIVKKTQAVTKIVDKKDDASDDMAENTEEMISFILRSISVKTEDAVCLNRKIQAPPSSTVRKVMARYSKKLSVSMDRLVLRCKGREWGLQEEVRGLANQTVWLVTVGEVKNENIDI